MSLLEIACFNKASAFIAAESGADRIELCANVKEGGTTPKLNDFREIRNSFDLPIFVMIRPRGGNFVYDSAEFSEMMKDILRFDRAGADGFVFGILDKKNEIDVKRNQFLVDTAEEKPCTFHRAFDRVVNPENALQQVIDCGFQTVLTSGFAANVDNGKEALKKLVATSQNQLNILVGGGLRSSNIDEIREYTNAKYFHSSAITDDSEYPDPEEIKKLLERIKQLF